MYLPSLELNHSISKGEKSPCQHLLQETKTKKNQFHVFLPLGALLVEHARAALLATDGRAGLEGNANGAVAAGVVDDVALLDVVARRGVWGLVCAGHFC